MAGSSRTVPSYPRLPAHSHDHSYHEDVVVVSDEELSKYHARAVPGAGGAISVYLKSKPGEGSHMVNIGGIHKEYFTVFNVYYREVMDKAAKGEISYAFDKYHVSNIINDVKYHCARTIPNQLNQYPDAVNPYIEYRGAAGKYGQYLSAEQLDMEIDYVEKCFDIVFLYASNDVEAYKALREMAEELIKAVNDGARDIPASKEFKTRLLDVLTGFMNRVNAELTKLSSSEAASSPAEDISASVPTGAVASLIGVGHGKGVASDKDKSLDAAT